MNDLDVLLVAFHYPPEISGGIPRALITESFLVRAGCRVRVMTPQPIGRGQRGGEIVQVPLPSGLTLNRAGAAGRSSPTRMGRRLRRFARRWLLLPDVFVPWSVRAARRALEIADRQPINLVVTSSPPESVHWIGRRLKRRLGCAWLADLRDGWTFEPHRPEAALPGRRVLERRLERSVLDGADWITAATRPIAEDLRLRYHHRRESIHFLPTGFERRESAPENRDDGLFRLMCTGGFGRLEHRRQSASRFFAGLRKAIERDRQFAEQFRLVLVGSCHDEIRETWSSPPVSAYVEQRGPIPYEETLRLSAGASMLLLTTPPGQRSMATRKLFDYLAVRRPVFALAEDNEAARILHETRAGLCVSPDDPEAVAVGLLRAFDMWRSGTLDETIPCSGNDLYEADPHFTRGLGEKVLAEVSQNGNHRPVRSQPVRTGRRTTSV